MTKPYLIYTIFILLLSQNLSNAIKDTFSRISDSLFTNIECVPHAYGDFNADKRVDILCVDESAKIMKIWLAQEKEPLFSLYKNISIGNEIVNIVPGDFTGDSVMDLLVTYKSDNYLKMSFFQGQKNSKYTNDLLPEKKINLELLDQPFVSDFNGDGKLDIMLSVVNEAPGFYFFDMNGTILKMDSFNLDSDIKLKKGFSHSITDVNNDYKQDLILTGENDQNKIVFNILVNNETTNKYEIFDWYPVPDDNLIYGQSLFADFDSDGHFEHLLPSCNNKDCSKPTIFIRKLNKWNEVPIDFGQYRFIPLEDSNKLWGNSISVKAGDYNLNGYLDLMIVLEDKKSQNSPKDKYAVLMKNIPSDIYNVSSTFNRTFKMDQHITSLFSYSNVVQASFFDLYDDGYLDILLVLEEKSQNSENSYRTIALKNDYYDDVYFVKVMVIPGLCNVARCPFKSLPYGLNYPGALVKIETTSSEFQRVVMYATQLSQSSYMALQLPYTIFGLGSTPNFVEHFTVGILDYNEKITGLSKEWHQIIPNSQLVISPYPRYNPYSWKMQLFITPSKNILITGIALGSTMICLIIMIGLLQFREKKMDEKERKIESQRFHFDGL